MINSKTYCWNTQNLLLFILFTIQFHSACGMQPESFFNKEELDWIKSHPSQEIYGVPIEEGISNLDNYMLISMNKKTGVNFKLKRLSSNYKDNIKTLPNIIIGVNKKHAENSFIKDNYLISKPFVNLTYSIITKANKPYISSINDLQNIKTAAKKNTVFFEEHKKDIPLIPAKGPIDVLQKVARGEVDAGILLSTHANRVLHNSDNTIVISNTLDIPPISLVFIVKKSEPILYSIIQKSLKSLTTKDLYEDRTQWEDDTEQTTPSIRELWIGYHWHILLSALLVISLIITLFLSLYAYRSKKLSEAAKSKFLAMMSHELRTPLGIVIASTELLQKTTQNQKQQQLTEQAEKAALSLLVLLNDVLDVSSMESGKFSIELNPTNLNDLLTKIYKQYQVPIQEKGLEFTLDMNNIPKNINLDEIRVQQIINNLLSNALKFTSSGSIHLSAQFLSANMQICIKIIDTGIGIQKNKQLKLFHPFIQADASTSRQYGGSGLGLSICKELITLMGGNIKLKSTLNKGTEISFILPAQISEEQDIPLQVSKKYANMPHTILLVEDHPTNQKIILEQLEILGYHGIAVNDGYQALATLTQETLPTLILLDCNLPGMDGYQIAEQIRLLAHSKSLPIIAISATTGEEHHNRCLDCGMNGVLSKPLKLAQLQSILSIWIDDEAEKQTNIHKEINLNQQSLINLFIQSNEEDFNNAQQAIDQKDYLSAASYIHRISSSALTMQINSISKISINLEKTLQLHPEKSKEDMQQLRKALNNFTTH